MDHHDFGGLHEDLRLTGQSLKRRDVLRLALGASVFSFLGCAEKLVAGDDGDVESSTGTAGCEVIPEETAGPFPGDGSNGPDVLNLSGVVRSDIRSSFAGLTGTAVGVPLRVTLRLVSLQAGCTAAAGLAVYLWHCDRAGRYSLYSAGATDQNYLRGVQESDANGELAFSTIVPGCYAGRWPHIHFEVYPSLGEASSVGNKIATSQLALPEAACAAVYATTGYEASVGNLQRVSLNTDNVFRDGANHQTASMSGSVTAGLQAVLTVAV